MTAPLSRTLALVLAASLLPGCAIDKTRRSVTFTMQEEIDSAKERSREIEKDLSLERGRIDAMEDRAAQARKRLADSGATLETFLDELTAIRGDISTLQHAMEDSGRFDEDMNLRLAGIEYQVAHMAKELGVAPAMMPMGSPPPSEPVEPAPGDDPTEPDASEPEPEPEATPAVVGEPPEGADAAFVEALTLVKEQRWEDAGGKLQKYLRKNRDSEHWLEGQYLVGTCLFELGRYKNAITEFQKVIEAEDKKTRKGAKPEWAPKAMLMQGLSFEELGTKQDLEAAALFFDELVRIYPDAPEAERAKRRLERLDAN